MSTATDRPYAQRGNLGSQQAEASTTNPRAAARETRILIELQLISMLLYNQGNYSEDLGSMRQDIADSIT